MADSKPPQHQDRQPGREGEMEPRPDSGADWYRGSGKLEGKRAVITGGDSGIGRAAPRGSSSATALAGPACTIG